MDKKTIVKAFKARGQAMFEYTGFGGYNALGIRGQVIQRGFRDDSQASNWTVAYYKRLAKNGFTFESE